MPLHPQSENFLQQLARAGVKPFHELTPREARIQMALGSRFLGKGEPVARVEDLEIPGPAGPIPVRIYRPRLDQPLPALVYLHGGGWLMGNLETHDHYCRALCAKAGIVVVSVDYRLAPEHKFPAAVEDAYAATDWLAKNASQQGVCVQRIAVGGDSAGGNLAAAAALLARERGTPQLAFQLLIYPVLDYAFDTASYRENASGFHLTRQDMICSWQYYLNNELEGDHPLASPLRAADLSRLPPAMVITAEFDPLRDEGQCYAERLEAAGIPVQYGCYAGMIHGFARRLEQFDAAGLALEEIAAALKSALHPPAVPACHD